MPYRFGAILAGAQGAIALLLAGAGIFGLITFSVARHTREIGIRMALGASRMQVIQVVARESFVLTLVGLAAGIIPVLRPCQAPSPTSSTKPERWTPPFLAGSRCWSCSRRP